MEEPTADRMLERVTDAWGVLLEGPNEPRPATRSKAVRGDDHAPEGGQEDADSDGLAAA
jgi:hypothetical protein